MPTTRRARYLFYRKRATGRLKKLELRERRLNGKGRERSSRERDMTALSKQWPKAKSPIVVGAVFIAGNLPDAELTPPGDDVPPSVNKGYPGPDGPPNRHKGYGGHGLYHKRRVKHCPRLHHLPVTPYDGPRPAETWYDFLVEAGFVRLGSGGHNAPRRQPKWRPFDPLTDSSGR